MELPLQNPPMNSFLSQNLVLYAEDTHSLTPDADQIAPVLKSV